MSNYFISGIGTEIGKTFVLTELIKEIYKKQKTVNAIKPIITGININNFYNSDSYKILEQLGNSNITFSNINQISPFLFKSPLSPDQAAENESTYINYDDLLKFSQNFLNRNSHNDFNFIEGAGGVFVPINKNKLIYDLIKDLKIKLILISNNYLGCLSHTISLIKNLKDVETIIYFNNYPKHDNFTANIKSLKNFTDLTICTNIDELLQNM